MSVARFRAAFGRWLERRRAYARSYDQVQAEKYLADIRGYEREYEIWARHREERRAALEVTEVHDG